ncbi:hypothetical protein GE061_004342 [Apolygus lucorum]|uniref:Uncharacterized protein n=1 Tax=Apolygus lucorum TaxID=248454 RepID=A0A8S9X1J4_APOLU|nr:hypothetical protein GE061_004342 [Apolygus lucorum]
MIDCPENRSQGYHRRAGLNHLKKRVGGDGRAGGSSRVNKRQIPSKWDPSPVASFRAKLTLQIASSGGPPIHFFTMGSVARNGRNRVVASSRQNASSGGPGLGGREKEREK